MVLTLYHKYLYFLYKFDQTLKRLTPQDRRRAFILGRESTKHAGKTMWSPNGSKRSISETAI